MVNDLISEEAKKSAASRAISAKNGIRLDIGDLLCVVNHPVQRFFFLVGYALSAVLCPKFARVAQEPIEIEI